MYSGIALRIFRMVRPYIIKAIREYVESTESEFDDQAAEIAIRLIEAI